MVSLLDAGDVGQPPFDVGLNESKYTRVKTPIGSLVNGVRNGHGNGWYFYPTLDELKVKSFGKRLDAVAYVRGELQARGFFNTNKPR